MRGLALLALWAFLTGFSPPAVTVSPSEPLLGDPFSVSVDLPAGDWTLAGLPDLSPFGVLESPHRQGDRLRLTLVALVPGEHRIPPLSLVDGTRLLSTEARPVRVKDPVAPDAEAAPIRALPEPEPPPGPSSFSLVAAALASALAGILLLRPGRRIPETPAPPGEPPLERQLEEIQAALQRLGEDLPGRMDLLRQVDRLRFGPWPAGEAEVAALRAAWRRLEKGEP